MAERQPISIETKYFTEKTPADLRVDFRDAWKSYYKGELPVPHESQITKDSTIKVEAYEVVVDPLDQQERRQYVQMFGLQAVAAGFEIAATISTPNVGFLENGHRLDAITYLLKSP